MNPRFSRRQFLRGTAAAAGLGLASQVFAPPHILGQRSPNSKLNTVVIGCANQGLASLSAAVTENLVAIVDVDENHLATTNNWFKEFAPDVNPSKLKVFYDYRKMFDEMHKDIDAVFVAAPDHHHYLTAMIAMSLGKGVYVEKPLAHTIDECRQMMAAAKKYKVVTQLGNQGHSGEGIRLLVEYIWAGAIGNVLETYSWAPTGRGGIGGRLPTKPVPAGLHWEEWIGPMPFRDYHDELHPLLWRSWWEFGDGSVGDWGCHNLDGPFWALNLAQKSDERRGGDAGRRQRGAVPVAERVCWNYPARGKQPPVKVYWYDGYFDKTDPTKTDDEGNPLRIQNRPAIVPELEKKYGRELRPAGRFSSATRGSLPAASTARARGSFPRRSTGFKSPAKTLPRLAAKRTSRTSSTRSRKAISPPPTSSTAVRCRRWSCWAAWPNGPARTRRSNGIRWP